MPAGPGDKNAAIVAKARSPFVRKLWGILSDRCHADVIGWRPDGRGFVIHDPLKIAVVLGHWFKSTNLSSFQRQLNYFHFSKQNKEAAKLEYANSYFIRDAPERALLITRKVNTGNAKKRSLPYSSGRARKKLACDDYVDEDLLAVSQSRPSHSRSGRKIKWTARPGALEADEQQNEEEENDFAKGNAFPVSQVSQLVSDRPIMPMGSLIPIQAPMAITPRSSSPISMPPPAMVHVPSAGSSPCTPINIRTPVGEHGFEYLWATGLDAAHDDGGGSDGNSSVIDMSASLSRYHSDPCLPPCTPLTRARSRTPKGQGHVGGSDSDINSSGSSRSGLSLKSPRKALRESSRLNKRGSADVSRGGE